MRNPTRFLTLSALVLSLPVTAAAQTPEARLTQVTGDVQIGASTPHAGQLNESLGVGQRVGTRGQSSAEITFTGETRARLGENTSLVMFGPFTRPPAGAPIPTETTLVRGTVRIESAEPAAGTTVTALPITTPAANVSVMGAAMIAVDAARVTRVSVQRGRASVRASGREIVVRPGMGLRVDYGRPPMPPHPLLAAPRWITPPPAATFTSGSPVDVRGVFAPAGSGTAPAQWHVQLARDEQFRDLVQDGTVTASNTALQAHALAPGMYFARVSGIDADRLEGASSPVVRINIASPRIIPGGNGHRASAEIPAGFFCGLDGAPLAASTRPVTLTAGRAHELRCATSADGAGAIVIPVTAAEAGPLVHRVRVEPSGFNAEGGSRTVVLSLSDGAGLPLSYANIRATVSNGASIDQLRESDVRGTYTSSVRWRHGVSGVRIHLVVNDIEEFDYALGNPQ